MATIDTGAAARAAAERRRQEQLREQQRREAAKKAAQAAAKKAAAKKPAAPPVQREAFSGGRRRVAAKAISSERTDLSAAGVTDARSARAALRTLIPPGKRGGNDGDARKAQELMNRMAEAAEAHSAGKPAAGYCLREVQDILQAGGFPGSQVPRLPYARNFAEHLNSSPANLKAAGLQKLDIDNPYDAPKGSIVVVRPGTPGTSHPTAGDIVIAGGNGRFYNDGEMGYGGPQNFPKGNDYVLGVYAPTGAKGAAAPSVEDSLTADTLQKIMPKVGDEKARELAPVLRDAMTAAKVKSPEEAAAFVAMVAEGTDQFSKPEAESMQLVVDAAQTWRSGDLGDLAKQGDLTRLAKELDLPVSKAQENAGTRTPQGNQEEAYAYFIEKGLSPAQAAGIVGNLMQESGVDPKSVQAGGPGRGIAQWSVGERWTGVEALARKQGKSPQDLGVQLDYLWQELNTTESASLTALKQTKTPEEAAVSFEENFERAGIPNNEARMANARAVLEKFGGYTYGGSQIGEQYYQRGLDVFGAKDEQTAAPSATGDGGTSSAGGTSSSGGTSTTGGAEAPSETAAAPASQVQPSRELASQVEALGADVDPFTLWFIEQLMALYGGELAKALESDPDFQKFVKAQKGMKNWKPGDKVPKAVMAAFMAKKLKSAGIDPKQPNAAAKLLEELNLVGEVTRGPVSA